MLAELRRFLVDAKRSTYAGLGDEATLPQPLLPGSMQLEWRDGDWSYRDVYFGMSRFSGLETVYWQSRAVWSMAYSGGIIGEADVADVRSIYVFLRAALMELSTEAPIRGPMKFVDAEMTYFCKISGDIEAFEGSERILHFERSCYALTCAGGLVQ